MIWQRIFTFLYSIQIHVSSTSIKMSVGCSHVQVLHSSSYYLEHKNSPAAATKKWHGKKIEQEIILLIIENVLQDQKYKHSEKPRSHFSLVGEEHQSPDLPQWHISLNQVFIQQQYNIAVMVILFQGERSLVYCCKTRNVILCFQCNIEYWWCINIVNVP